MLILAFTVTFAVMLSAGGNGEGPSGGAAPVGSGESAEEKTGASGGSGEEGGYYYFEERLQHLEPYAKAIFAGGCFWCLEQPFEKYIGVAEVISGYTGGEKENPAYREVASGKTDHIEAVTVYYNPEVISYEQLLEIFWRNIDPTDDGGQFIDRGDHYTTAIFYSTPAEKRAAEESKKALEESGKFTKPIVTVLREAGPFYPAEEYHQDFFIKSSAHYKRYRSGSGRDQFIEGNWVSPGDAGVPESLRDLELKEDRYGSVDKEARLNELTSLQYSVTQEDDTEPPFQNKYWSNKEEGIYVDIVSGEPLFSSTDKYQSGTGWPSFTRPIEPDHIIYKTDTKLAATRVEVRSYYADSHLGHVFEDGPEPTGLRYCINSAALRFVPRDNMEKEGYAQYMVLF